MRAVLVLMLIAMTAAGFRQANAQEPGGENPKSASKPQTKTAKPGNAASSPANDLFVLGKAGKELKVANYKFLQGVRPISWSADPEKIAATSGPLYLEFREHDSTLYKDGILTLVPLTSLCKVVYQPEKQLVTATTLAADGKEQILKGVTRFVGINKLAFQGDADLGDLGSASLKFHGGDKDHAQGIAGFRLANPKPAPAVNGPRAEIFADDKEHSVHKVSDLKALYQIKGRYWLTNYLMFQKTVKLDLQRLASLKYLPSANKKRISDDYQVQLDDGIRLGLTLIREINPTPTTKANLVGLVGQVPSGYKLFPMHTISELRQPKAE